MGRMHPDARWPKCVNSKYGAHGLYNAYAVLEPNALEQALEHCGVHSASGATRPEQAPKRRFTDYTPHPEPRPETGKTKQPSSHHHPIRQHRIARMMLMMHVYQKGAGVISVYTTDITTLLGKITSKVPLER